jgi:DnaJ homolog subfamily C member 27
MFIQQIRNEFYKDTQGLVVVYDVTNRDSFDSVMKFLGEAKQFGGKKVPGVLCANKIDQRRVVTESEGREFAKINGLQYFETSASSGANVKEMFDAVFCEALMK